MLNVLRWLPPFLLSAAASSHAQTISDQAILFATQDESPRVRFIDGEPHVTYYTPDRNLGSLAPATSFEPVIITDPEAPGRSSFNGFYVADGRPVFIWRTTRPAQTGSERVLLTQAESGVDTQRLDTAGAAFHPVVAEDGQGIAAVWTDDRAGDAAYQVRFNRMHRGEWLASDSRVDSGDAPAYDPMIAMRGDVVVAGWSTPTQGHALHLRRSLDAGDHWSEPITIMPEGEAHTPVLLAVADGWRLMYFVAAVGIVVHSSTDGLDWGPPRTIPGTRETGSFSFRGSQAGKHLCLTWTGPFGGPATTANVYAVCSADAGEAWMPVARMDTDLQGAAASLAPVIAVDDSGRVIVVWQDLRDWRAAIYANASTDGGQTWRAQDVLISTTPLTYDQLPAVAGDGNGRFVIAWSHGTGDNPARRTHVLAYRDLRLDCGQAGGGALCDAPDVAPKPDPAVLETRLRERATTFWSAYLDGDFAAGYHLFDPFFRAQVAENQFLARRAPLDYMEADITAIAVAESGRRATVTMTIVFKADDIALGAQSGTIEPTRRQITEAWVYVDGDWFKLHRTQAGDLLPRF